MLRKECKALMLHTTHSVMRKRKSNTILNATILMPIQVGLEGNLQDKVVLMVANSIVHTVAVVDKILVVLKIYLDVSVAVLAVDINKILGNAALSNSAAIRVKINMPVLKFL